MFRWIQDFREANPHIKYFIFNWVLYSLLIMGSMAYVYIWMIYDRTIPKEENKQIQEEVQK
jgi:hypothetical protein